MGDDRRCRDPATAARWSGILSLRCDRRWVVRHASAFSAIALPISSVEPPFRVVSRSTRAAPAVAIGALYSLTGGLAPLDIPARDGSLLALDELNASGGVLGQPAELVIEDVGSDPEAVTVAARRLIDKEQVVALIGLTDGALTLPAATAAQDAGIPFLAIGATAPVITLAGDFVFLLAVADNVQAAVGAEFARDRGWISCGLMLDSEADSTRFLAWYFADRFQAEDIGGQIVAEVSYATDDTDFSAQLTELHDLDPPPDFVYVASGPQEIGTIVTQAREIGLTLPIVGGDGLDTPLLLELAGAAAEDVFFATHQGVYGQDPTTEAFRAAYEAAYGTPPPTVIAALGYDGALLMADAINRAGGTERKSIRDALAATRGFAGVTGTVTYAPGVRVPNKGCALVAVKDGKFVLLENMSPERVPPVQATAGTGDRVRATTARDRRRGPPIAHRGR